MAHAYLFRNRDRTLVLARLERMHHSKECIVPSTAPATVPPDAIDSLHTVRDWLRIGVTLFTRAQLVYGHGTRSAVDESAFLILMALDLPIDELAPWLDARLTMSERTAVADLFTRRIVSRKPASYLVNSAFIQGHRFYVDERVIVPRSYIGELLAGGDPADNGMHPILADFAFATAVLDLCTGSGCLAILAARALPLAQVDAVDVSADALAVARRNVDEHGLGERIRLVVSDVYSGLAPDKRYDLIIANPPYVATGEVAAFDAEYRAEPEIAHAGGADGLDLVHRILRGARDRLNEGGLLVMEVGTGQAAWRQPTPTSNSSGSTPR
jgi:ribosomal protein L3 glutamine methyltransferase